MLALSALTVLAGAVAGSGQAALFLSMIGAGAFGLAALVWTHQTEPDLLAIKFFIMSYSSQPLFVAGLALLGYFDGVGKITLGAVAVDSPALLSVALMIMPAAGWIATSLYLVVRPARIARENTLAHWLRSPPANLGWFLMIGAVVSLSVWVVQFIAGGVVGYVLRVLHKALFFVPLLAGAYAFHYRRTMVVWALVLGANLVLGFVTGARSWGFYPIALYGLGMYLSAPRVRRRWLTALAIPVGITAIFFLGLAGVVRDQLGRGGGEIVNRERINDAMIEATAAMNGSTILANLEAPVFKALTRIVRWTNVVVPLSSPRPVAFRGLVGLRSEVTSIFSLGQFSATRFSANEVANDYGFRVDEGTSVEFGILPDGWSRAGLAGALVYGIVAGLFLISIEILVRRYLGSGSALMLLVLSYVVYIGFVGFISYSLMSQIRLCLLCIGFLSVLFWPVDRLTLRFGARRK